jgi:hypothetical protein
MNPRIVAALAVVVFGVVASAIWFLQSKPAGAPVAAQATPGAATPRATPSGNSATGAGRSDVPSADLRTDASTRTAAATPGEPLAEWEIRIDNVLSNPNQDELSTAKTLISLMPTMPTEGQVEAANHITNLITDKDYNLVLPMLKNAQLSSDVHDVLVTDLMNREDPVKLPALLEVAKIPNHPYHEEALTDLQIFLDGDFGNNWQQWDTSMKEYLRKLAAEEAESAPAPAAAPAR